MINASLKYGINAPWMQNQCILDAESMYLRCKISAPMINRCRCKIKATSNANSMHQCSTHIQMQNRCTNQCIFRCRITAPSDADSIHQRLMHQWSMQPQIKNRCTLWCRINTPMINAPMINASSDEGLWILSDGKLPVALLSSHKISLWQLYVSPEDMCV